MVKLKVHEWNTSIEMYKWEIITLNLILPSDRWFFLILDPIKLNSNENCPHFMRKERKPKKNLHNIDAFKIYVGTIGFSLRPFAKYRDLISMLSSFRFGLMHTLE